MKSERLKGIIKTKYYANDKGELFFVLHEAIHAITEEPFVVYQSVSDMPKLFVSPKDLFLSEMRVENEEHNQVCREDITKYVFPIIPYTNDIPNLVDGNYFSTSVKGMRTLLLKRNIIKENIIIHCEKDDDIEQEIIKRIKTYSVGENMEEIFHLIQLWGGMTGRGIYIHGDGFNWENIAPHYKTLVDSCLSTTDICDESIENMVKSVKSFYKAVSHMGVAFITKHTRYWLMRTLENNALPIYDSVMANCVMRKNTTEIQHLLEYWKVMKAKAIQENIDLVPLERQIFKYAFNRK